MKRILFLYSCILILNACDMQFPENNNAKGLRPIYIDKTVYDNIAGMAPQTMKEPGKIYMYNQYILINELYKGIHIVDNSDPYNPVKIKFISIPGNKDMAVKNGILYADNCADVVAIDLRNINDIKVVKRLKNLNPLINQFVPEFASQTYFECVDTNQGYVIGWEEVDLVNPKCYVE